MPTTLGPVYDKSWKGDPVHMLKPDVPVWKRFVDKFGDIFDNIYYDVRVGGPDITKLKNDILYNQMWYNLTAKRIDAVGETKNEVWIIEVSAAPGLRAAGQILVYRHLWHLDPKIKKPVVSCLVCEMMDSDLEFVLYENSIRIYLV